MNVMEVLSGHTWHASEYVEDPDVIWAKMKEMSIATGQPIRWRSGNLVVREFHPVSKSEYVR